MPRDKPLPEAGYIFFGDSFSRIFTLIAHPEVGVKAFKGATAKGLTKEDNDNRQDIVKALATRPNTQCSVFVFGNVDVHMSHYYNKYAREPPVDPDLESIAKEYVGFIAGLPGAERAIIGAYPSSLLEAEAVPQSLAAYGVLTEEQSAKIDVADCTLAIRQGRVREFNQHLKAACAAATPPVTYYDVFDALVDPATLQLRPEYLDISDFNIHVVWETTVLLWLDKLPWLRQRIPKGFEERMRRSLNQYLREKVGPEHPSRPPHLESPWWRHMVRTRSSPHCPC